MAEAWGPDHCSIREGQEMANGEEEIANEEEEIACGEGVNRPPEIQSATWHNPPGPAGHQSLLLSLVWAAQGLRR